MASEKFDEYMKELGKCVFFCVQFMHASQSVCARTRIYAREKKRWMLPVLRVKMGLGKASSCVQTVQAVEKQSEGVLGSKKKRDGRAVRVKR